MEFTVLTASGKQTYRGASTYELDPGGALTVHDVEEGAIHRFSPHFWLSVREDTVTPDSGGSSGPVSSQ